MVGKKIGCERKFNHKMGQIIVGTVSKKNCGSIYLVLETRITPEVSLTESVKAIRKRVKANMRFIGSTYIDNLDTYLIAIDYNQTKVQDLPGKTSFVRIELTLFGKFEFDDDFIFTCEAMGDSLFTLINTCDCFTIAS
jgi:hypothetical protein